MFNLLAQVHYVKFVFYLMIWLLYLRGIVTIYFMPTFNVYVMLLLFDECFNFQWYKSK